MPQVRHKVLNTNFFIGDVILYGDYFLYNWCTSEGKGSGSNGGGGGGGDDNGCGIIALIFLACLALSTQCNCSRVNDSYFRPSSQQIDAVEDVDCVAIDATLLFRQRET